MTPQAGDFNGDGRDDVAIWYSGADGITKLWTLPVDRPTPRSTRRSLLVRPERTPGTCPAKFVTGDFNGDGRGEISVFYGQGNDDR